MEELLRETKTTLFSRSPRRDRWTMFLIKTAAVPDDAVMIQKAEDLEIIADS